MIVKIVVTENKEAQPWDVEKFVVESDFPATSATSQVEDIALQHVKGSVLCAIGMFKRVPDKVEFVRKSA